MENFIRQYFIDPIYQHSGYNTFNTIVYGLALGFAIILLERAMTKRNIEIDRDFLIGITPFIVLAALVRSLVDAGIFPTSFFTVTPGIFFTTLVLYIGVFILGGIFTRRFTMKHSNFMLVAGLAMLAYPLLSVLTNIEKIRPLFEILLIFLFFSAATIFLISRSKFSNLKNNWVYGIFTAHYLDASSTFVGVDFYGFFEEYAFENYLMELAGTALIIFPLKIVVLLLVVYTIQKTMDDNREFWYFAVMLLGFAAGLRNVFTIMLL